VIDVAEVHAQHERVVLVEVLAAHQRLQREAARRARQVGREGRRLDTRLLQHPLRPPGLVGPLLDQLLPVADEGAQPDDVGRSHEAVAQEPVLDELSQPAGVAHAGPAAGQRPDVVDVDQQDVDALQSFERVPDRSPVDPGRLHRHLGDPLGGEPVAELAQRGARGAELAHLLPAVLPARASHACQHGVRAHVQRRARLYDHALH
jgi:hypothetical protein